MINNKKKYKINVQCTNCGFKGEVEIDEGVKINEHRCSECGNSTLKKPAKKLRLIPR